MSWLKKTLFSGLSFLFFFLIGEGIARLLWVPPEIDVDVGMQLAPHQTRIWSLQPGTDRQFGVEIHIGENGLRSSQQPVQKTRWLTLGDSSIFGHGLRDEGTLHSHLSTTLEQYGQDVEVLCGGVPGYSILQSRRLMNDIGWSLEPSVLVIGNLWSDNNFDHFVDQEWLAILDARNHFIHKWLSHSKLWGWMNASLRPMKTPEKGDPHSKISWLRDPYKTGKRRVPVNQYASQLDELIEQARQQGIGVILLQPANIYRLRGTLTGATWEPYFIAQREIAEHRNIPIVDVATVLRAFKVPEKQAFLDEMHPTDTSNKWIAQAIVLEALQFGWPDNQLLPSQIDNYIPKIEDPWEDAPPFESNTQAQ